VVVYVKVGATAKLVSPMPDVHRYEVIVPLKEVLVFVTFGVKGIQPDKPGNTLKPALAPLTRI
jgi:hypothetical protein